MYIRDVLEKKGSRMFHLPLVKTSLQERLTEIDAINTDEKIIRILEEDVIQTKGRLTERGILLTWPTTSSFLRRLQGDKSEKPGITEMNLSEMNKFYPDSKALKQTDRDPNSIAVACIVLLPGSIRPPWESRDDKIMQMSLTVLAPDDKMMQMSPTVLAPDEQKKK